MDLIRDCETTAIEAVHAFCAADREDFSWGKSDAPDGSGKTEDPS